MAGDRDEPSEHHLTVARTARWYALGDPDAPTDELWIVCHGFGQLARDFIREFEPLRRDRRLVVAPEALSRYYLNPDGGRAGAAARVGATWMTREDRLEEIRDYVAYLDTLLAHLLARTTARRVIALGFSQGVATVSRWAMLGRSRIDRLVLWAGTLPPETDFGEHARTLARLDLHVVAGEKDSAILPEALAKEEGRLRDAGIPVRTLRFSGGHRMDRDTLRTLADGDRVSSAVSGAQPL